MKQKTTLKKPFKLTRAKYFSPNRPHISNSMVTDYLKSPAFFKKKYIDRVIPKVLTPAMKMGQCVDALLAGEKLPFHVEVLRKENAKKFEAQKHLDETKLISRKDFRRAAELALAINESGLIAENASFQKILEKQLDGALVCGMTDITSTKDGVLYIDDVKCSSPHYVRSPANWYRHCEEMGYFRQLACYRYLYNNWHNNIVCRHIVAVRHEEGLIKVYPFIISSYLLDKAFKEFQAGVEGIARQEFDDTVPTWAQASLIKSVEEPENMDESTFYLEEVEV